MRGQFVKSTENLMEHDSRVMLLLGDISVWPFRHVRTKYPGRVFNLGVCEQAMAGAAAGLALEGYRPIIHSIAPFVTERIYEQVKVDIAYQNLPVRIVSIGASYDYAASGYTHFCPGDVAIMKALPNMAVVVPGTAQEFDYFFQALEGPAYFRLASQCHHHGSMARIAVNRGPTVVIAVGPTLDLVLEAARDLPVTVVYYAVVAPFDGKDLNWICRDDDHIVLVEPYNAGGLVLEIQEALHRPVKITCVGVRNPKGAGWPQDHDTATGLTVENVRKVIEQNLA